LIKPSVRLDWQHFADLLKVGKSTVRPTKSDALKICTQANKLIGYHQNVNPNAP